MTDQPLITSRQNPRIVAARKLADRKHRRRQGCFLVEGLAMLAMALDAGAKPAEVFYVPQLAARAEVKPVMDRLQAAGAEPVAVTPEVMAALADRDALEGVVATFALFEQGLSSLSVGQDGLVLILDRLQDPGNLGTLIRTADAVAAAAVVLVEPCVDPFDPKVVRGTMGSLFHVPIVRTADVTGLAHFLHGRHIRLIAADAHQGVAWGDGLWQGGVALALGNEARGLSPDIVPFVDAWARLPIAGQAESLNVAVAGGILMYLWLRSHQAARPAPPGMGIP